MKKSIYLVISILLTLSLKGQLIKIPYQEVGFKNLTPVWIYSPIDSSLIGDGEFNGRNHFNNTTDDPLPFVIDNGYLYCAHHTSYATYRVEGALLQKIDINTGKVMWQNHYDLRNNDKQEWIEAMYIDDEGILNVVTDRRIVLDNWSTYETRGDSCLISIRKYKIENGELIEHIKTDTSDRKSLRIKNSRTNATILYPLKDGSFQYYEIDYYVGSIVQYNIDQFGHLLKEPVADTFKFIGPNRVTRAYKVSEDTLVSLNYSYDKNNKSIDTQTVIVIFDKNLNKTKQFQLDSMLTFNFKRLYIRRATHDYIFISGDMFTTGFYDTIANIVVNYEGKIIKQFTSVYDGFNHYLSNIFSLDNDSDFYLTTAGQRYYGLDFVKTNDSWVVDLHKEYYAKDKHYLFEPIQTVVLENKDLLVFGYNSNDDFFGYYVITWPTWMRISGEDLGFRTSTSEINAQTAIRLSPNPTSDYFSFTCEESGTKNVEILDNIGRVVLKQKIDECDDNHVSISTLKSGLYVVRLMSERGELLGSGKIVVEK